MARITRICRAEPRLVFGVGGGFDPACDPAFCAAALLRGDPWWVGAQEEAAGGDGYMYRGRND